MFSVTLDPRAASAIVAALIRQKTAYLDLRKADPFNLDLLDRLAAVFWAEDCLRRGMGGEHDGPDLLPSHIERGGLGAAGEAPEARETSEREEEEPEDG